MLGYCHGDKENARRHKEEKASRLASLMPSRLKNYGGKKHHTTRDALHIYIAEQMIQRD